MEKKIDALPDIVGLSGAEFVILDDGTITSKTTVNAIIGMITKLSLGLDAVENTADLDKAISTAVITALNLKADITALPTKLSLGLDAVENTADVDKPISTLQQAALAAKEDKTVVSALTTRLVAVEGKIAVAQVDSTATDIAGLVTDFNSLLVKLKASGLMA